MRWTGYLKFQNTENSSIALIIEDAYMAVKRA